MKFSNADLAGAKTTFDALRPEDRGAVLELLSDPVAGGSEQSVLVFAAPSETFARARQSKLESALRNSEAGRSRSRDGVAFTLADSETVLIVTTVFVRDALQRQMLDPDAPTAAETDIAAGLLAGFDLREIATEDNVSYETRRSQLKSLTAKLGLSRQAQVIAALLAYMAAESRNRTPQTKASWLADTVELSENTRIMTIAGQNGQEHRFVDMGRVGAPISILLHSQVIPPISSQQVADLEARDQRFIWPVRSGAMAAELSWTSFEEHLAHSLDSIDLVRTALVGGPVHLVGLISGACYAAAYALRAPAQVARLSLVGSCYRPNTSRSAAGNLRRGLFQLARSNDWLFRKTMLGLGRRLSDMGTFERTMRDIYQSSPSDSAVLDWVFDTPEIARQFQQRFVTSTVSIKHDFDFQRRMDWHRLAELKCEVEFLHGADDPIHALSDIQSLARARNLPAVEPIADAGQLIFGPALTRVTDRLVR